MCALFCICILSKSRELKKPHNCSEYYLSRIKCNSAPNQHVKKCTLNST